MWWCPWKYACHLCHRLSVHTKVGRGGRPRGGQAVDKVSIACLQTCKFPLPILPQPLICLVNSCRRSLFVPNLCMPIVRGKHANVQKLGGMSQACHAKFCFSCCWNCWEWIHMWATPPSNLISIHHLRWGSTELYISRPKQRWLQHCLKWMFCITAWLGHELLMATVNTKHPTFHTCYIVNTWKLSPPPFFSGVSFLCFLLIFVCMKLNASSADG